MIADKRPTLAEVRQMCKAYIDIEKHFNFDWTESFNGSESTDFYLGMLAALRAAITANISGHGPCCLVPLAGYIADHLERREIS